MLPEEPAGAGARALLERIVDELDLEASVAVEEDDEEIDADVDGEDVGLLIGRRGQTIDALQLLCYQAAFRGRQDASGSPSTPPATASARASRCGAAPTGPPSTRSATARPVEMDPMSAHERRVVHEHLKDRPGIETYSEGDEPDRCVVVAPLVSRLSAARARRPSRGPASALLELLGEPRAPELGRRAPPRPGRSTSPTRLSGLEFEELSAARRGSPTSAAARGFRAWSLAACAARGAGRPDRVGRAQVRVHRRGDRAAGIDNARVVCERSEELGGRREGREAYDAVTARAVGRLCDPRRARLAAAREGGVLVAWKGARSLDEEAELERVADRLAMRADRGRLP